MTAPWLALIVVVVVAALTVLAALGRFTPDAAAAIVTATGVVAAALHYRNGNGK